MTAILALPHIVETKNQCEDEPLLDDESVYDFCEGIPPKLLDKLFCFDGKKRTTEEILEIAEMLGQDSQRERQEGV